MKKYSLFIVILILLGISFYYGYENAQGIKTVTKSGERIGIYDSRSVAVAYYGSSIQQKQSQVMKDEYNKAKAAGDQAKVSQMEAQGKAQQQEAHMQGFSTASVDNILGYIKDAVLEIKKQENLTVIISKWDKAELKKHTGATTVDITEKLVDAFHPNDRQRKSAIEIQKIKPIPLDEAKNIRD